MSTLTKHTHMLTVRVPHADFEKLEQLAEEAGCDRGAVAKRLIQLATLDQVRGFGRGASPDKTTAPLTHSAI